MKINEAFLREKLFSNRNIPGRVNLVFEPNNTHLAVAFKEALKTSYGGDIKIFEDIDTAHNNCEAGRGDAVIIMPGHYAPSASIALDTQSVLLLGYSTDGRGSDVSITGASGEDEIVNISANKVHIDGIRFNCYAGKNGVVVAEAVNSYHSSVKNCRFVSGAIQLLSSNAGDAVGLNVDNCRFIAATTSALKIDATDSVVENCILSARNATTVALIDYSKGAANTRPNQLFKDSTILGTDTAAIGLKINATAAGLVCAKDVDIFCCTDHLSTSNGELIRVYSEASGGSKITS